MATVPDTKTELPPITVPQFRPFIDMSDYEALRPVFEGNYIAEGPKSREFHKRLLEITGAPYGVFACNGTLALYLAMRGLNIGQGDEVLVQDVTFIASANGVEMVGAKPVFVDVVSPTDLTIDLEKAEAALTPNTKAMVIAHLFGSACTNIEEIAMFCRDKGLLLIEDAAQSLGITNGETHTGLFGDIATFSFYADKTITTAEGGFIITKDPEVEHRMKFLRNQGRTHSGTFVHPEVGYNFRITDMQAALGLSQLSKLETIKERKSWILSRYQHYLGDKVEFLKLHPDFNCIPFRVVAFVEDAERTTNYMRMQGVEPRQMFYPLHRQPCYAHLGYTDAGFENANETVARGICLPTWCGLSEEQIKLACESLLDSLK